jgi:hypothetical protein
MAFRGPDWRRVAVAAAVLVALTGCGRAGERSAAEPTAADVPTGSPTTALPPCDPGGGFPTARDGCPDAEPETGWLKRDSGGGLSLRPFRTLGNDAEGKAYAERRGLEFPFPNDYFDAPTGAPHAFELDRDTVCTGIIVVGYREPLEDHAVDCTALVDAAAARGRVSVAVWQDGVRVVQVSELYRP